MIKRASSLHRIVPWLHAAALVLFLGSYPCRGADAQSALPLTLQPGRTCLERAQLEQRLFDALSSSTQALDLTVEVLGSSHDPRSAEIRLSQGGGEVSRRAFRPGPPRCEDFHDAIALAIKLMLRSLEAAPPAAPPPPREEPDQAASTPALPRRPPPPRVTAQPVRIEASRAPVAPAAPRSPLSVSARAAAALGSDVGAQRAAGGRLELAVARSRYSLVLGLLALFGRADRFADTQVSYVSRPLAASVQGCVGSRAERSLVVRGCLGLLGGRRRSRSLPRDGVETLTQRPPWLSVQATLELSLRLQQTLHALLAITPVYAPRETRFEAEDPGDPSEALPRFGALFTIGLQYDFYRQGSPAPGHE